MVGDNFVGINRHATKRLRLRHRVRTCTGTTHGKS
jgi:hypothetical protein